jgi:hypothetical protein
MIRIQHTVDGKSGKALDPYFSNSLFIWLLSADQCLKQLWCSLTQDASQGPYALLRRGAKSPVAIFTNRSAISLGTLPASRAARKSAQSQYLQWYANRLSQDFTATLAGKMELATLPSCLTLSPTSQA